MRQAQYVCLAKASLSLLKEKIRNSKWQMTGISGMQRADAASTIRLLGKMRANTKESASVGGSKFMSNKL